MRVGLIAATLTTATLLASEPASAQTLSPPFVGGYQVVDLGVLDGVESPLGGLTTSRWSNDVLLIGGAANALDGRIYSIGLSRDGSGHIVGFSGAGTPFASAPRIDGGLAYAPNGVLLFTQYPINAIGQILPGSASTDKSSSLGTTGTVGSLGFVPWYAPNAGAFKVANYQDSTFYDVTLFDDGLGTFNLSNVSLTATLSGRPEGFVYVPPGSPGFSVPSMLLAEYATGAISIYAVDAGANPIGSRSLFMSGLTGLNGAFLDPVTGDLLFSVYSAAVDNNRVYVVRGFTVPEPSAAALTALGGAVVGLGAGFARRRRLTHAPSRDDRPRLRPATRSSAASPYTSSGRTDRGPRA